MLKPLLRLQQMLTKMKNAQKKGLFVDSIFKRKVNANIS
jgi:hypothetical protein